MRVLGLALAACLWLPASGWAQAAPAAPTVTLAEALQAARDSVDVSLARRTLAAARADVVAADHAPAPVLTTKATSIDLENGVGPGNALRDKRIDKSVGLDWTWERGNKRELRTRVAERTAEAAQLDVAEVAVQQQVLVASAFYELLAAQERVGQVAAIEKSAADLTAAAQRRQRAGDISQQESLRTEIEARRAQADLRAAQAERVRAMLALGQLIGRRGEFEAEAAWPPLTAEVTAAPADVEQRADLQAAQQRVLAARAALDHAQALRRNDVTVGTSLDHYPGTSRRLLELRLQVPLAGVFGTYGQEGEIDRARAALEQAQDQLEKTRRAALADAGRLAEDLRAAADRATAFDRAIVPRARQVASMAELAYSRGALPLVDLVDARRTLRSVLLDDIAARAEYARARTAWQLRQAPATP
ncbi:MAG TPA: TolC family protein [Ramlibacter sp.]|jgi:cobalt-zinc-cadmium efflux system outer membrane protein|uniref:TolC family protein n=1 Tax=Ramlibacter sp. TaxID=1917967 RepID=UPI002D2D4983|nr:TolC family protein [Ramlibacter sp.]HZY17286.1 TolC family protein [Ramlibacter sp.]